MVKLLNDRWGIQVRGGCSCAGTYGHFLLHVDRASSRSITEKIDHGDLSAKPGWVRLSLHPTMTDAELDLVIEALHEVSANAERWKQAYTYDVHTNEYVHEHEERIPVDDWFGLEPELTT